MRRRRSKHNLARLARRRKSLAAGWTALVLLAASIALDQLGAFGRHDSSDWRAFDRKRFHVARVVDGDTVRIISNPLTGEETLVRLLGIDAPETGMYWSDRATEYMTARALNREVTLRLEPTQTRDRYKRLLAYVYLSDTDCLNLDFVRDGQAFADRRFRHTFAPQFEMAETEARKKQRGLWKDLTEDQMPDWRRRWLQKK